LAPERLAEWALTSAAPMMAAPVAFFVIEAVAGLVHPEVGPVAWLRANVAGFAWYMAPGEGGFDAVRRAAVAHAFAMEQVLAEWDFGGKPVTATLAEVERVARPVDDAEEPADVEPAAEARERRGGWRRPLLSLSRAAAR
jgi:hypothetical protein